MKCENVSELERSNLIKEHALLAAQFKPNADNSEILRKLTEIEKQLGMHAKEIALIAIKTYR